jgi:hypothetical protein
MRVIRTRRGARVEQGGLVLSEVLDRPGPTHSLFDLLAASVSAFAPGPRCLLLGFAAGGVVAPLRALGWGHPLEAVDLSREGEALFRELSDPWCGRLVLHEAEAARWLASRRRRYDAILEDLSLPIDGEVTKPPVSLDRLPRLMASRLTQRGVAVVNVLPVPGRPWTRLLPHLARPFPQALVLTPSGWENRVLILGRALGTARDASARLRRALEAIGSREARAFRVGALRRGAGVSGARPSRERGAGR